MSKPINPIIYRLGYTSFWKLRTNVFKSADSFKNQYFIIHWLQNLYKKLNIHLLDWHSFEDNQGILHFNITCIHAAHKKKFKWIRFSFLIRKWLNIWFFKQPWNKRHKMWAQQSKDMEKHPFFCRLKRKRLFLYFFLKIFLYQMTWFFNNKLHKKIVFNIRNIRFLFVLENDSFVNLLANTITIKTGLLKKKTFKWIDTLLWFLTLSFFTKNADLFGKIISFELEKNRKHNKTLRFLNSMISLIIQRTFNSLFNSLIFQVKGKINAVDRKIKRTYKFGKGIPFQTKKILVNFALIECFTFTGVISIKVWLY